jgi:alkylhydroperoxidase family enzyme
MASGLLVEWSIADRKERRMEPMYLPDVEEHEDPGPRGEAIRAMKAMAAPVPQILHLFAYKPDRTEHLARFTQGVMRATSPLPPGQRELIAAFTSKRNECPF